MKKQHKADVVSPVPQFIVNETSPSETISPQPAVGSSCIELFKNLRGSQQKKKDEQEESCGDREEEPVKNSMFWLYRRFPHIV